MDWSSLGLGVLGYVFPVLAIILTSLAAWGLQRLAVKFGIDINLKRDAAIRFAVRAAIAGAEEWAARKLKLDDQKVHASEKLAWVKKVIEAQWPKLLPDDLDRIIDEELATMRGVGATGDKTVE